MKVKILASVLLAMFTASSANAEINYYVENVVSDAKSYEKELGRWMATKDAAKAGYQLTLFSVLANGYNPATHVTVVQTESYDGIDKMRQVHDQSETWQKLGKKLATVKRQHTEGHADEIVTFGKQDWEKGDVLAAIAMNVSDVNAYQAGFEKLAKSKVGKNAPGMIRLMRTLEGGSVTHYILVSAPSFSALNTYLDSMADSAEYLQLSQAVASKRKILGVRYIRVDQVWKP